MSLSIMKKRKRKKKKSSKSKSSDMNSNGGYRPVLVDKNLLSIEATALAESMSRLKELYTRRELNDPDTAMLYILIYLNWRYSSNFLGNLQPIMSDDNDDSAGQASSTSRSFVDLIHFTNENIEKRVRKRQRTSLFHIVNDYNLRCVPYSARVAMVNWYMGHYDLVLLVDKIPSARQVLTMQAAKKRCVSLISEQLDRLVLGERDPLSFLLHDLVHAYKMFSNEHLMRGQVGFCRALLKLYANDEATSRLDELIGNDAEFADAYDYLISDMNSHPKHLFFYFKAILINAFCTKWSQKILDGDALLDFERLFDLFLRLFEMNDEQQRVARNLFMYNTRGHCVSDDVKLKQKEEANIFDSFFLGLAS